MVLRGAVVCWEPPAIGGWCPGSCSPRTSVRRTYPRRHASVLLPLHTSLEADAQVLRGPYISTQALTHSGSALIEPDGKAFTEESSAGGACYGCGARLQTTSPGTAGYVAPEKFSLKKKHRQLRKVLCERCGGLCNGAMIPAVQDFAQKSLLSREVSEEAKELLGKALITPEELRKQLLAVRGTKAIVVLLVDLLDVSGTLMTRVRDFVGKNPIILVGTKMDLLPEGARAKEVGPWLSELASSKRLNVVSTHLVSSHTGEGIAFVTSKICKERKSRDVYVVGAANVGKSAFVRAMLREMSKMDSINFEAAAMGNGRYLPVESAMPGTTLGLIPLQAFNSGGKLYDTPGVHLHHRVPHMLAPEEVKLMQPRRRLTTFLPPSPTALNGDPDQDTQGVAPVAKRVKTTSATYVWSDLVRLDILRGASGCSVCFYTPSSMPVIGVPLLKQGEKLDWGEHQAGGQQSLGSEAASAEDPDGVPHRARPMRSPGPTGLPHNGGVEPTDSTPGGRPGVLICTQSVGSRGGLVPHPFKVKAMRSREALADVTVSGVPGWISIFAPFAKDDLHICVWAPRGVEVFLRPPMLPKHPAHKEEDEEDTALGGAEDDEGLRDALSAYTSSLGLPEAFEDPVLLEMMANLDIDGQEVEEDEEEPTVDSLGFTASHSEFHDTADLLLIHPIPRRPRPGQPSRSEGRRGPAVRRGGKVVERSRGERKTITGSTPRRGKTRQPPLRDLSGGVAMEASAGRGESSKHTRDVVTDDEMKWLNEE